MKELKALVFTKAVLHKDDEWVDSFKTDEDLELYLKEVISELEALQAPKTCDGCFWSDSKGFMTQAYCPKCNRNDYMEDRYVNKETQ